MLFLIKIVNGSLSILLKEALGMIANHYLTDNAFFKNNVFIHFLVYFLFFPVLLNLQYLRHLTCLISDDCLEMID